MNVEELIRFANYQKENWSESIGNIKQFDYKNNVIELQNEQGTQEYKLNTNAQKQALERLRLTGVLSDFNSDKEWQNNSEVIQFAVNKRIEQIASNKRLSKTKVIFDVNDNNAKAVKTEKYHRLMNFDVINHIVARNGSLIDYEQSFIDENHLMLYVSNVSQGQLNQSKIGAKVGDTLGFGYRVTNSETGNSEYKLPASLTSQLSLIRLACTNGMLTRESIDIVADAHIYENMRLKLEQAVVSVLSNREVILQIINNAITRPAIISSVENFPKILKRVQIPQTHYLGIIEAHLEEPLGVTEKGINAWGVYNAVTRYNTHKFPKSVAFNRNEQELLASLAYPLLVL